MQRSWNKNIIRHSFWLSLLLHLLFLSAAVIVIVLPQEQKKPPQFYVPPVPAYVYKGAITPSSQSRANRAQSATPAKNDTREQNKTRVTAKTNLPPNAADAPISTAKSSKLFQQSVLAASFASLKQEQFKSLKSQKEEDPILLIGDQNEFADPLIKLLGKSLSANFNYPEMEGKFGIRGRTVVKMILHPDGHLSDVQMVKSSDNDNLDAAALYAVNNAPLIPGANRFLEKPKHFVVGFVFY